MERTTDNGSADCPLCHELGFRDADQLCARCVGRVRANFFRLLGANGLLRDLNIYGRCVASSGGQPVFRRGRHGWNSLAGLESARKRDLLASDLRFWATQVSQASGVRPPRNDLVALGQHVFKFVGLGHNWAQLPVLAISLEYWMVLAVLILDPASRGRYLGPCLAENGRYPCQEPLYELADQDLTFCLNCQAYWLIEEHRNVVRREVLDVLVTALDAKHSFEVLGQDSSCIDGLVRLLVPDDRHPVTREPMFVLRRLMEANAHSSLLRAVRKTSAPAMF